MIVPNVFSPQISIVTDYKTVRQTGTRAEIVFDRRYETVGLEVYRNTSSRFFRYGFSILILVSPG